MDIPTLRLRNHCLSAPMTGAPRAVVAWMGAMQAQDLPMAKWAVGVRLRNATGADIDAALDEGEIIRIHALRPTWHLLAAEDVRWILGLTAPNILRALAGRHRELELTGPVLAQSRRILEKALRNKRHATREDLIRELNRAGISTANNRGWHVLVRAELDRLICNGKSEDGKSTYALMDERIPPRKPLRREEALARLADRYYASHGPAQEKDFAWWSGLSVREAKIALGLVKAKFISETVGGRTFWFRERRPAPHGKTVHLLPPFDEYLIGYADRSDVLGPERGPRAVSANGVFRPTIVVDGLVTGLWKRAARNGGVALKMEPFSKPSAKTLDSIEKQSRRYKKFWGLKLAAKPV